MSKTQTIWENRYKAQGNSGNGSYGVLCEYKARFINEFINHNDCKNVIEFGSGDGNQMSYFEVEQYTGVDISEYIIEKCKKKYEHLENKHFVTYDEYYRLSHNFDLALSLDVIYHLVDDIIYEKYMNDLFSSSSKYVIIYSNNIGEIYNGSHVYKRKFSDYIDLNFPHATLLYNEPNPHSNQSSAEFFVYDIQK
jgi:cyclopropane fatty-acyl-phospholipid synthase-like methyltransferase